MASFIFAAAIGVLLSALSLALPPIRILSKAREGRGRGRSLFLFIVFLERFFWFALGASVSIFAPEIRCEIGLECIQIAVPQSEN